MSDRSPLDRYPLSGLWHAHTERTDGEHSAGELVAFAAREGFPLLAITEHVRRKPTYDFEDLYRTARRAAADEPLTCLVGCEAKVLDADGTLDAPESVLDRADVVYGAFHGTPLSRERYREGIHAMLANPVVDVWAHPLDYARRRGFDFEDGELTAMLESAREHDVRFEMNLRKPTRAVRGLEALRSVETVVGYDLHDIDRWTGDGATAHRADGRRSAAGASGCEHQ